VVECRVGGGLGGGSPLRLGQGLPVVVTFGLQQGSRTQAWCYDGAVVSSVGGASNGPSSGSSSATVAGFSFGSAGYSGRARVGRGAASSADMTGGARARRRRGGRAAWLSARLVRGLGGGSPLRLGQGLPVVVTFGLQQGSRTQAWCYDGAVVSSVGGASNGPSSGSSSATVAGFSFGSAGYSGRARVGRGAASSADMTGGARARRRRGGRAAWLSARLRRGLGGGSHRCGCGQGLPVVVTFGLQQGSRTQAWCYDGAVVSSVGGASNGPSSGSHVRHGCGLQLRERGLQRAGAGGARGGVEC